MQYLQYLYMYFICFIKYWLIKCKKITLPFMLKEQNKAKHAPEIYEAVLKEG